MPDGAVADAVPQTAVPTFLDYLKQGPVAGEPAVDAAQDPAAGASNDPPKPDDGSAPSAKPDKVEARKREIQRDIDSHVARREAAKREADAEEARLQRLRQPEPSKPAPAVAQQTADGVDPNDPEPTEASYQDWAKFQADHTKWLARVAYRQFAASEERRKAAEAQTRQNEETAKNHKDSVADFERRGQEYAQEHDDYPELVQKFKETRISQELEAVILWGFDGAEGPAFLHDLLKEPAELERIEKLPTPIKRFSAIFNFAAGKKIAALEAKVAELESRAEPRRSKAPATGTRISDVAGGGSRSEPQSFQGFVRKKYGPVS